MLKQRDLPVTPKLILQRLDKIAAELKLLRQTVITIQDHPEKTPEQNIILAEAEKHLPDLREFRASLAVHGDSLRESLLREREGQRF